MPGSATRLLKRQQSGPVLGDQAGQPESLLPPSKNDQQVEEDRSLLQLLTGLWGTERKRITVGIVSCKQRGSGEPRRGIVSPRAATGLGAGSRGNHKEAGEDGIASLFFLLPTRDAFFPN